MFFHVFLYIVFFCCASCSYKWANKFVCLCYCFKLLQGCMCYIFKWQFKQKYHLSDIPCNRKNKIVLQPDITI